MSSPFIFVSCGQYTDAEKRLGKSIVQMVKTVTGLDAFFAEEVQDLNGLDSNILNALRDCAAFITVMHPRGHINRPDGSAHIRASVWLEQEIAIATYIQRAEQRKLPVIAFVHRSVGREGIRDLIHLNPTQFEEESEVLEALPERLAHWKTLTVTGISIQLRSVTLALRDEHPLRRLEVNLVNDSNERITQLSCLLRVPAGLLKHFSDSHAHEIQSSDPLYRSFRITEKNVPPIEPHDTTLLTTVDYCTKCAMEDAGGQAAVAGNAPIEATIWTGGKQYKIVKTIMELAEERAVRESR